MGLDLKDFCVFLFLVIVIKWALAQIRYTARKFTFSTLDLVLIVLIISSLLVAKFRIKFTRRSTFTV